MILHIVSPSPFAHDALQRCLAVATAQDAILLIEDATLALRQLNQLLSTASVSTPLFVLEPDRLARGVPLPEGVPVQTVDYNGFVELTIRYAKTISWF